MLIFQMYTKKKKMNKRNSETIYKTNDIIIVFSKISIILSKEPVYDTFPIIYKIYLVTLRNTEETKAKSPLNKV